MSEAPETSVPSSERLIHLIHVAGLRTMLATKSASAAAAGREEKAYAELFAYVVGRKPTADELKQMIPC